MVMKNLIGVLFLSLVMILGSCSSQMPNGETQTLNLELSGSYTLEYINASSGTNIDEGFPNKKPTLTLESITKKLTGNTGCNQMFGSFSTEQNKINFSGLGSTKMFCEGVNENAYTSMLEKAASYRFMNNKLSFFDEKGLELLRFTRN